MNKPTVGILFGGPSSEYEISLRSACTVCRVLLQNGYRVLPLGMTRTGALYRCDCTPEEIRDDRWLPDAPRAALLWDGCVWYPDDGGKDPVDVLFPVMHGETGEDGRLQGMLSLSEIPYVGCGCAASAVAMDKAYAAQLSGLPAVPAVTLFSDEFHFSPTRAVAKCEQAFPYPLFVKPARCGSSRGTALCPDRAALQKGIENAAAFDNKILVQPFLRAREIEVALLQAGQTLMVSPPGEVLSQTAYYDYETKYGAAAAPTRIPAVLTPRQCETVRTMAARAFRNLECRGLARADFFLTADGTWYFNELNTMPGFTETSMYPRLMEACGVPMPRLMELLLAGATGGGR